MGMAHPRKTIRQAVVALLVSASTGAGGRVHATRVEPLKRELPAISVYILSETVDADASAGTAPREITRNAKVEITGFVAHTTAIPVDDAMDNLAEEIEAAMDVDPYLGGAAGDSILEGTEMEVIEDDGRSDPLVGVVTLTYSVTYRTSPEPPTDADDFLRADVVHQLVGGAEDTEPAEDMVTVQET